MKKTVLLTVVILTIATLFTSTIAAEPVKLAFRVWGTTERVESEKKIARTFMDQHPDIEIEVLNMGGNKLRVMIAAGEAPDVFRVQGESAAELYSKGVALCLDTYIERDNMGPMLDNMLPGSTVYGRYNGHWYGLPRGGAGAIGIFYYNRNMFDEAGLIYPESDWTWDDFREYATKLTVKDGDQVSRWGAYIHTDSFHFFVLPWIWNNGGDLFNDSATECLLASTESLKTLQWISDLATQYEIAKLGGAPNYWAGGFFVQKKTAMHSGALYDLSWARFIEDFDWSFVEIPRGPKGQWHLIKVNTVSIASDTKYPEQAWTFVKYLISPDNQKLERDLGMWQPVLKSVIMDDSYLYRSDPPYDLTPGILSDMRAIKPTVQWPEIQRHLRVTNVLNGQGSPAIWAKQVTETINAILKRD